MSQTVAVGTTPRAIRLSVGGTTIATLLGYACNLVLVPALLRDIGPGLYGTWATIASLLAVGGLADAGVRTEIVRRVGAARGAADDAGVVAAVNRGVSLLAVFALGLVVVGAVGAPAMRAFAFPTGVAGYSGAALDWLIRGTFLLLAVELVVNGHFAVLRGLQRGDAEALAIALSAPVGVVATLGGVVAGWGLWALLVGGVAQLAVQVGVQTIATTRLVPALRFRLVRIDRATARGFAVLGGLALIAQIGDVVDTQWDKVVLARYVGTAAVASFQIGTTLVLQAKVLALIPIAPMLVAVAELRHVERERLDELCRQLGQVGAVAGATVLGAVFVFAPAFIHLWLGSNASASAIDACRIFVIAVAINLWCAPLAFRALGHAWPGVTAVSAGVNMAVNGVASLALTFHLGFRGPLIGSIVGNVAGAAALAIVMRRRLGAEWQRPPMLPYAAGALMAALAIGLGADGVASWPALVGFGALWAAVAGPVIALSAGMRRRDVTALVHS
ncbi:MAG: hypothetical protein QOJ00_2411 [Actinomycetota bacterium]